MDKRKLYPVGTVVRISNDRSTHYQDVGVIHVVNLAAQMGLYYAVAFENQDVYIYGSSEFRVVHKRPAWAKEDPHA